MSVPTSDIIGGYELQQISLVGDDGESSLWFKVRRITERAKYYVALVKTEQEIAAAIALYERWGIITEP